MIVIDSDNALGSPAGDVDDAFAITALLRGTAAVSAVASIFGNTTEPMADANNRRLGAMLGFRGIFVRGAASPSPWPTEASRLIAGLPAEARIAALGPLTNLAAAVLDRRATGPALELAEVVAVGSNSTSKGRWPPFWPFEFNFTKDRAATRVVFESRLPLTIFPLDVARQLTIRRNHLLELEGELGKYLSDSSGRWFRHLLVTRLMRDFPVYDLAAAMYLLGDEGIRFEQAAVRVDRSGWIDYRKGTREIRLVTAIDRNLLWERFRALLIEQ